MAYLNKIMLIGNVGKDPEVRTLAEGNMVAKFTLATTKNYKDRNGDAQQSTAWFNIVAYGNQAKVVSQYVKKGTPLYVEGEIEQRTYLGSDNNNHSVEEVRMSGMQLLSRKDDAGAPRVDQRPAQPMSAPRMQPAPIPQAEEIPSGDGCSLPWE